MKTTLMIATVLAAGASAVYAQDPPAAQQPPTAPAATTASTPGPTKPAPPSAERLSEVHMLESILANAVNQGASALAHEMQQTDPGSLISINQARARGIALDGYGVLFDVDVPLMNMSVMWSERKMFVQQLRNRVGDARRYQARATTAEDKQRLQDQIDLLTTQIEAMTPRPIAPPPPPPTPVTPVADTVQAPPGTVVAANTPPDVAPVASIDTRSTDEMYTDAIKKALMDAMVNHSSALNLTDAEWLLVAARDNNGPTIPGAINDRSGIILRIKGSDLAAFRANKLSRDEVLKKVEILEWR